MNKRAQAICVLCLIIGAPAIANAHVSLEHGLVAGLVHPLTALDHWVTLLAASVVLFEVGMLRAATVAARISAARSALGMPLRQASRAWKD